MDDEWKRTPMPKLDPELVYYCAADVSLSVRFTDSPWYRSWQEARRRKRRAFEEGWAGSDRYALDIFDSPRIPVLR